MAENALPDLRTADVVADGHVGRSPRRKRIER
jgi:hypothetical protein